MKFCKDCQYIRCVGNHFTTHLCIHESSVLSQDPVTGDKTFNSCYYNRTEEEGCGLEAKNFKERSFLSKLISMVINA